MVGGPVRSTSTGLTSMFMSEANRITGKVPPWWCPSSGDEAGTLLLQRWLSKWSRRSSQGWEDEFPHKNTDGKQKKKEWAVLSGNCEQKEKTNQHYLSNGDDSNLFGSLKASPKAANYKFFFSSVIFTWRSSFSFSVSHPFLLHKPI